jgi:unsaturated chondroitin disaccharide hydrolase
MVAELDRRCGDGRRLMDQRSLFRNALDFAASQSRRLLASHPGYTPMYTVGGKWRMEGERWTHWCEGFYPGIYWLLYKATREPFWREQAEKQSAALEPRRFDRAVHDLGFLFFSTYLRWYNLTGEPALKQILIDAGRTLALRRQMGGYLASFLGPQSLFIDIMMNVGIILWAANATADETLRQIALEHCRATQRHLVRSDGGTAHEGVFDPVTGQFLREGTQQGLRPDSTWSRGQAWAIYGFTAVHRLSGAREFLETAKRCADCYLLRAPARLVPLWDFDVPDDGTQPFDSSAAAITASGLFDLSEQVNLVAEKERYRQAALTILDSLASNAFLAQGRPDWEGILLHGVYHYHKRLAVDESVSWGDFFFVEAIVKALAGRSDAAW